MSFPGAPADANASAGHSPVTFPGVVGLRTPAPVCTTPATPPASAPPLVDPAALQDLGAQMNNPDVARDFARDYAKMWQHRYRALLHALADGGQPQALDAVLSLKTSSLMIGGVRLAQLAGELEAAVRSGDLDRARALLGDVAERGSETVDELQFSYVLREN